MVAAASMLFCLVECGILAQNNAVGESILAGEWRTDS